jgi:hypothetical protein
VTATGSRHHSAVQCHSQLRASRQAVIFFIDRPSIGMYCGRLLKPGHYAGNASAARLDDRHTIINQLMQKHSPWSAHRNHSEPPLVARHTVPHIHPVTRLLSMPPTKSALAALAHSSKHGPGLLRMHSTSTHTYTRQASTLTQHTVTRHQSIVKVGRAGASAACCIIHPQGAHQHTQRHTAQPTSTAFTDHSRSNRCNWGMLQNFGMPNKQHRRSHSAAAAPYRTHSPS